MADDLKSRVTGGASQPKPPMKTPAPAAGRPIRSLPMAPGQIIPTATGEPALTAFERASLEKRGWKAGQPIPDSIQELASVIRAEEAAQPLPPPVPLDTPPAAFETVDISQLDPSSRAEVMRKISEVSKGSKSPPQAVPVESPTIASQAVYRQVNPYYQPATPQQPEVDPEVIVDVPSRQTMTPPAAVQAPVAPPPAAKEVVEAPAAEIPEDHSDESIGHPTNCPHCRWDLSQPDIPEPSYADKQSFLHAVLGQKPFMKTYDIFAGALQVTFRTLTTKEVDKIYFQTLQESKSGQLQTSLDYWERINRYRLYLQILKLDAPGVRLQTLPEGFTVETNPHAGSHWKIEDNKDPNYTGLLLVENYVLKEVLGTEMLLRCVQNTCQGFNRLVSKLEALMDDSDFWKKTEEQS